MDFILDKHLKIKSGYPNKKSRHYSGIPCILIYTYKVNLKMRITKAILKLH